MKTYGKLLLTFGGAHVRPRARRRLAALCLGLTTLTLGGCGCFRAGYGIGYGCGGAHVSVGTSDPVAGGILLGVFAGAAAFEAIFGGCRD